MEAMTSRPARKPEARLAPHVQQMLTAQLREEEAAAARSRTLRRYVGIPLLLAAMAGSVLMAFSDDLAIAMVGQSIASSALIVVWKARKRIQAALGLD